MHFEGEYEVPMDRAQVWARLHDPEVLQRCLPGCESLEPIDDGQYRATVVSKVGPIRARFKSLLKMEDIEPLHSYRLTGKGDSGPTGSAKGEATIVLTDIDAGTLLKYDASVTVTGRLAQIGSRLLEGAANSFAAEFFRNLADVDAEPASAAAAAAATAKPEGPSGHRGLRWLVVAVLVALLVAFLVFAR